MPNFAQMNRNAIEPPSRMLTFIEGGRALVRFGEFMSKLPKLRELARGDDHPVLVMPGFLGAEFTTLPLRSYLKRQGYRASSWGLGTNLGHEDLEEKVYDVVEQLFEQEGRKLSLIGWSLGGVYAREAARFHPEKVRQVITLGSPFKQINRVTSVSWLYELIHRKKISEIEPELINRISQKIDVRSTNIFSKSDGIVPWRCCVEEDCPKTENIEVSASHLGLGHHPSVLKIIADRLAQTENDWAPYNPTVDSEN